MAESDDVNPGTEEAMPIRRELLDELLQDSTAPQDMLAEGGFLKGLTKAVIERC